MYWDTMARCDKEELRWESCDDKSQKSKSPPSAIRNQTSVTMKRVHASHVPPITQLNPTTRPPVSQRLPPVRSGDKITEKCNFTNLLEIPHTLTTVFA
jgi:hypothetical protein